MTPHLNKQTTKWTNKNLFYFECYPNSKISMKMAISTIKQLSGPFSKAANSSASSSWVLRTY